jgi:hypothetical protein
MIRWAVAILFYAVPLVAAAETLPAPEAGKVPMTVAELWAGFDPGKEPLETEVLKEWEQDGVVCRIIRYRVGVFKGEPATVAAFYGFPKGGTKLPAIVDLHGGGQSGSRARMVSATNSVDRRRNSRTSHGGRSSPMHCCHWPIVAHEMGTAPMAPGSVGPTSISQSTTHGVRIDGKSGVRSSMAMRCSRVSGSVSASGLACLVERRLGAVPSHASCRT